MTVLLLSPDSDFAALLSFLLERAGMRVTSAHPAESPARTAGLALPGLLLVDLTDEDSAVGTAASAAPYRATCPQLVLYHPAMGAAWARHLLPQAAAYLPVPLRPREFVAAAQALVQRDEVVGHALSPALAR